MIGQILGHYEVVEAIGAGGMGAVYRARDRHLQRDVAVKILPAGVVADGAARKRFRQEAFALSRLNHPNIATVFDFDTQEDVDFLAMELVRGTPLSDRLRAGVLPEADAVRIGLQLARGLAAAHAEGVIHRDVKPGNVMLGADGELKILDFGLAILAQPGDEGDRTRSSTESSSVAGTLPYMSPEQVRGQPGDARSDVYGAGAVLYELATGRRPFGQSQSGELIGAILHESPAAPRTHNPRISPGFERLVMKALARDPLQRYQSAQELRVALESLADGSGRPRPSVRPWIIVAGVAGAAALVTLAMRLDFAGGNERGELDSRAATTARPAAGAPVRVRRSVAVLGFRNLSGRPDDHWLSMALSEMLTTELAAGEHLRTIPGENIAQMKISLSLADAESYGPDTLSRIRANLGTDDVVFGSYLTLAGGQVRLDLRLQDAVAGDTLAAVSERGSVSQLDELVNRAGSVLREKLGADRVSARQTLEVKAATPANAEAVRWYAEGLARLRVFDNLGGRELLEKAAAADPQNPLIHSALANAWSSLGYDTRARAEATRAFELSRALSREDQLAVEGKFRETTAEHDRAVEIYKTLAGYFPDSLDFGLRLASAEVAAGRGTDALATVEALRRLPPPASLDPRLDLAEASALGLISDFKRQQEAAARAAAKGMSQGARLITARAQMAQGAAAQGLGDMERAMGLYEEARKTFAAAGEGGGAARALRAIAFIHTERGDYARSETVLQQALAVQREIGDQAGVASTLYVIGITRYRVDDLVEAKRQFTELLRIRREIDDKEGTADGLNGLGLVLADEGDAAGARKMHEEGLAILRSVGKKSGMARALNNLALVMVEQYDFSAALRSAEEALAIRREIGDRNGVSSTSRILGQVFHFQGDLPRARQYLEEALKTQQEAGLRSQAAYTMEYLASVLVDEGQAPRAELMAQASANEHRAAGTDLQEALSLRVLAEAQLAQSKRTEARAAIDRAMKLRPKKLAFRITAARVLAAEGRTAEASRRLEATRADAIAEQDVGTELAARLALGELDMRGGRGAEGRVRLSTLERDATARGFLLIARQARTAAGTR